MLAEIKVRITGSKLHAVGLVGLGKVSPTGVTECTVNVRQEDVRRALEGIVYASLKGVLTGNVVPVVLSLPGVHDASLREVGGRAHREEPGGGERNSAGGITYAVSSGNGTNAVATEVN